MAINVTAGQVTLPMLVGAPGRCGWYFDEAKGRKYAIVGVTGALLSIQAL
jgi:hypothetical protein